MSLRKNLEKTVKTIAITSIVAGALGVGYFGYQYKKTEAELGLPPIISLADDRMQDLNNKVQYSADSTIFGGALLGIYGLYSVIRNRSERKSNQKMGRFALSLEDKDHSRN